MMLHGLSIAQREQVLSLESNDEWLQNFEHLQSDLHTLELVSNWEDEIDEAAKSLWGVVFIDFAPVTPGKEVGCKARGYALQELASKALYLIVHDSELPEIYGYDLVLDSFKYRFDSRKMLPQTTVVSRTRSLKFLSVHDL
jgi:hypothetical protein